MIALLSTLITQKSCNFSCNSASEIPASRPRELYEMSKDEKRAAFEHLLNDPDTRYQFVTILSNDNQFNQFIANTKADAETIEVLNELRQIHQVKLNLEVPNEEPAITIESGDVPRFKPAKFKKIRANVDEVDTIQLPTKNK